MSLAEIAGCSSLQSQGGYWHENGYEFFLFLIPCLHLNFSFWPENEPYYCSVTTLSRIDKKIYF